MGIKFGVRVALCPIFTCSKFSALPESTWDLVPAARVCYLPFVSETKWNGRDAEMK